MYIIVCCLTGNICWWK